MALGSKDFRLKQNSNSERLSDTIYEKLVEGIVAGRLASGTILSELELAREFKVSRTPIHDALRQLAKDELVEQEANHRAVVAGFSSADVFDIFEMRKLLEGEAARRAAIKIDRVALLSLRDAAERLQEDKGKQGAIAKWVEFDDTFHTVIATSSGSPRLAKDIVRYRMLHRSFNRLKTTSVVVEQALAEHLRILEALERRDADKAASEMVAHIHEWQAYFVNRFDK